MGYFSAKKRGWVVQFQLFWIFPESTEGRTFGCYASFCGNHGTHGITEDSSSRLFFIMFISHCWINYFSGDYTK